MRILVTGAGGFVGSNLVRAAVDAGHEAVAATHSEAGPRLAGLLSRVETLSLDVGDPSGLRDGLERARPDVIINCAAVGAHGRDAPDRFARVNTLGLLTLHRAAVDAHVARFIHVGTAFEYGPNTDPVSERTPLVPIGMYAASKAAGYLLLRESSREHSPRAVVVRLFNLFGPHDAPTRLASQIVRGAATRTTVNLTRGSQQRDFLYVDDAARDLVNLATLPEKLFPEGEDFNLSSGRPQSVREFSVALAEALGALELMDFGKERERSDAPSDLYGPSTRFDLLMERAGIQRSFTSLEDAARLMLEAEVG